MSRPRRAALAGLAALALAVSVIGPCHCVLNGGACQRETQQAGAHACCEKPTGVQAAADECCDSSPGLVVASTDVPKVAPPVLQVRSIVPAPTEHTTPAATVRTLPPPSLERTTVLLI
jgi:hypothetical protein